MSSKLFERTGADRGRPGGLIECTYSLFLTYLLNCSHEQEYVNYYGTAGVQHIAMNTCDIIKTVTNLKARGQNFLTIPDSYYKNLNARLKLSNIKITESMEMVSSCRLLSECDNNCQNVTITVRM